MYGLINKAIEQMVCTQFGADTWETIKRQAHVDSAVFLAMDPYPDDVTYRLVGAASTVLGLPAEQVLRSFGRYWTLHIVGESYGPLLHMIGGSLREFLLNLDNMHARVGLSFPDARPPSFKCTDSTAQSIRLHYHSDRQGLAPMVIGLLEGLAMMFKTAIGVEVIASRDTGDDHEIFEITFQEQ
jgi:hypothetical protein